MYALLCPIPRPAAAIGFFGCCCVMMSNDSFGMSSKWQTRGVKKEADDDDDAAGRGNYIDGEFGGNGNKFI
jgi:hypothetical protein